MKIQDQKILHDTGRVVRGNKLLIPSLIKVGFFYLNNISYICIMISEKLKSVIFDKLYQDLKHCEIIPYDGSIYILLLGIISFGILNMIRVGHYGGGMISLILFLNYFL